MKAIIFLLISICMLLFINNGNSTTTLNQGNSIKISFYYDANLNGKQDGAETIPTNLKISASGYFKRESYSSIRILKNQIIELQVSGDGPSGKRLINATFQEPQAVIMLPNISFEVREQDVSIGLSDGFLTSPIKPRELNLEGYKNILKNPSIWKTQSDLIYPKGWPYPRNYFFYGYRIPEGGLKGTPHLAFDFGANPGTPVLAAAPGIVVKGLYDWKFGINARFGTVYYNHIVPSVSIGEKVKRYDIVGYIAENQGNHLHFELRPNPENILSAFPGVGKRFFIKSPLNKESVPIPPYFGQ